MRGLSKNFMDNFLNEGGLLNPVLERLKKDHTLMLSIRKNYVNIYYRGGNLLKITEQEKDSYKVFFDFNYNKSEFLIPDLPETIKNLIDVEKWLNSFHFLKGIMDLYFSERNKLEREFQQLIARENNFSGISNETEYFISDIEFAESEINARFDMLALRWLASERKNSNNFCPVLIEVKYGDGALDGTAGILKHLQDMDKLVSDKNKYENLLSMMKNQFNQLDELGLLKFNRSKNYGSIEFDGKQKPELVFILANHNPRSTKLKTILNDPEIKEYAKSTKFDLRFYVSCFAGYALHSGNMFTLDQFLDLLNR